ncbi:MAG: hypothetical protein PHS44_07980 [Candidatus Dojkabacteria bacterium]|nr:hypothetical protein [Candidatus Dojkabacteria bacterium]
MEVRSTKVPGSFIVVALTFLVTALVTGLVVYLFQEQSKNTAIESTKSQYTSEVSRLNIEIIKLNNDLDALEEKIDDPLNQQDVTEGNNTEKQDNTLSPAPGNINFIKSGNLVAGPKLLYEEPGSPALSVDLLYENFTICIDGSDVCTPASLDVGTLLYVAGVKNGSNVTVYFMQVQN